MIDLQRLRRVSASFIAQFNKRTKAKKLKSEEEAVTTGAADDRPVSGPPSLGPFAGSQRPRKRSAHSVFS
ncbi:hypothetical protein ASD00_29380 [Ensifer sp. Root31]|nr:hypothetical protein ASD00_29380 [Ensifer sp. Root31]